ncbi:hypothetical protein YC2023_069361 [Brassica napus]
MDFPSPTQVFSQRPFNFNGTLYMWEKGLDDPTGPGVLVAHDFFAGDDDECRVWKLKSNNNSDGEWWQLAREEIDMASLGFDVLWE